MLRAFFNRHVLKLYPPLRDTRLHIEQFNRFFICPIPKDTKVLIVSYITINEIPLKGWIRYKQKGIKVVLFLFDSIELGFMQYFQKKILDYIKRGFIDVVYSFDRNDCSKYGFLYWEQVCTPIPYQKNNSVDIDLYFAGRDKGRYDLISSIASKAVSKGFRFVCRMPDLNTKKSGKLKDLLHECFKEELLTYNEILLEEQQSNCLLDIVQQGQTGLTWRVIEALYYNKKLITNNKSVKNNRYYNPKWMKIIDYADEIDSEWLKEREDINYQYKNDYSSIKLINEIKRYFNI